MDAHNLPWWVFCILAIAPILIGILTYKIGVKRGQTAEVNARTAKEKMLLDLREPRMQAFDEILEILIQVRSRRYADDLLLGQCQAAANRARLLFEPDVGAFLDRTFDHIAEVVRYSRLLMDRDAAGAHQKEAARLQFAAVGAVSNCTTELRQLIARYVSMTHKL